MYNDRKSLQQVLKRIIELNVTVDVYVVLNALDPEFVLSSPVACRLSHFTILISFNLHPILSIFFFPTHSAIIYSRWREYQENDLERTHQVRASGQDLAFRAPGTQAEQDSGYGC